MNAPEHERCSHLLRGFVNGDLADDDRLWVEEHLGTCATCAQELAALRAVVPEPDAPQLSELERVGLRRAVLNQAVPVPAAGADAPAAGTRSGSRLWSLLGAAALVAVIGTFAYLGFGGMSGGDDQAGITSTGGGADSDAVEEARPRRGRGASEAVMGTSSEAGAATGAPSPTFRASLGEVDPERLNKLGEQGLPLVVFSRAYTVDDVPRLQGEFIESLAERAPDARGDDIRECAGLVTTQFPNALPAYAALAEYRNRGDILVLAFAWSDQEQGPLDQSMVWAWAVDDCAGIPVHYSKNVIQPRP
ncbi:MAG: zf-HC2 domain-containing protein [Actinomycetota bacterium]|nr:zf-HC2 domain-containing protein [Actinomycetota bacterium]